VRIAARQKEWYLENKSKRLDRQRRYTQNNKEKVLAYRKEYRAKNRDKLVAISRAYRLSNPVKVRLSQEASRIKGKYGITHAEYMERIAAQDGKCEICKQLPSGKRSKSKLHLDHCHTTGQLRGFICGTCNTGLGMAKDSIAILEAMISYIRKYAA